MIYQRKYRIACLWLGGLFLALGFFAWGGLPRSTPEIEIRRAIVVKPTEKRRALEDLSDVPVARPATGGWLQSFGGYTGHIVRKGETIRNLASAGGSTESLIASYNAIRGPLAAGRCVIIPNLQNAINTLKSEPFIVEHATTRHERVALTLDAGSTAEPLPRILNALSKRRIKITFFVTGYFVRENPDLVRQIAADGHEFGNHSLSHPDLRHVDDKRLLRELMETERLLLATAGASTRPFFRPPYGEYDNHVLLTAENLGFIPIYWTLDSLDSVGAKKNGDFLYNRVTGKLSAEQLRGAIILMHVDSMGTADALPRILDRYAEMGLEVCKLSRVLNDT